MVTVPVYIYSHTVKRGSGIENIVNNIVSGGGMFALIKHYATLSVKSATFCCDTCLINKISVHRAVGTANNIHTYLPDMVNRVTIQMRTSVRSSDSLCICILIIVVSVVAARCTNADTTDVTYFIFKNIHTYCIVRCISRINASGYPVYV